MAVVAYNFHTNSKHSESTLLSCTKLPAVSNFQSEVKEIERVAHERQARSENIAREDWSHSILMTSHDLQLAACTLPILWRKLNDCSHSVVLQIGTHYTRNYKNKYTGPLFKK